MTDPAVPASIRLRAAIFVVERVTAADPYANLESEPKLSAAGVDTIVEAATRVAEQNRETNPAPPSADAHTPRSAPCPCGSGGKFKRCCGRAAPGFVNQARAA